SPALSSWTRFGISSFVAIAILLMIVVISFGMYYRRKDSTSKLTSLDFFFLLNHDSPSPSNIKVESKQTARGGFCTIIVIVAAITFATLLTLEFIFNNTTTNEVFRIGTIDNLHEGTFKSSITIYGTFEECDGEIIVEGFNGIHF